MMSAPISIARIDLTPVAGQTYCNSLRRQPPHWRAVKIPACSGTIVFAILFAVAIYAIVICFGAMLADSGKGPRIPSQADLSSRAAAGR